MTSTEFNNIRDAIITEYPLFKTTSAINLSNPAGSIFVYISGYYINVKTAITFTESVYTISTFFGFIINQTYKLDRQDIAKLKQWMKSGVVINSNGNVVRYEETTGDLVSG